MEEQEMYQAIKAISNTVVSIKDALGSLDERITNLEQYVYGDDNEIKEIRVVQNENLKYSLENMKIVNSNTEHIINLNDSVADINEHLKVIYENINSRG